MDIIQVLTIIGIAIANIGTTITLFLWATSNATSQLNLAEERTDRLLQSIQNEMKDFHARLCVIEQGRKNGN